LLGAAGNALAGDGDLKTSSTHEIFLCLMARLLRITILWPRDSSAPWRSRVAAISLVAVPSFARARTMPVFLALPPEHARAIGVSGFGFRFGFGFFGAAAATSLLRCTTARGFRALTVFAADICSYSMFSCVRVCVASQAL